MKQDVGGCEANCHTINQQGAGVRDQGDALQGTKHHLRLASCGALRSSHTGNKQSATVKQCKKNTKMFFDHIIYLLFLAKYNFISFVGAHY